MVPLPPLNPKPGYDGSYSGKKRFAHIATMLRELCSGVVELGEKAIVGTIDRQSLTSQDMGFSLFPEVQEDPDRWWEFTMEVSVVNASLAQDPIPQDIVKAFRHHAGRARIAHLIERGVPYEDLPVWLQRGTSP